MRPPWKTAERGGFDLSGCERRGCVLRCGQIARSRWRCFGAPKRAARACENRFMQIAVPLFCQCGYVPPAVLRKQPNPPSETS